MLEVIHSPHRSKYLSQKQDICPFCNIDKKDDEEKGVFFRAKFCYCIMNLYPYTPGHFMVIPYEHIANLSDLRDEVWLEMSLLIKKGELALRKILKAQGVNLGMNLSDVAGAGIPTHLHYHLVPRYFGDTNFITTIAQTRICGKDLNKLYLDLKQEADKFFTVS
ncbi:HIT domain-containing protein [uncultured Campylobacter sp.]|uniref:HIT family protein n=1 Tax=uncultured Campylobacter sp. TaxID=218934 RepID=UPI0026211D1C|nr:HIT domain-containing protein [uncultured Campylobacter sp.]